MYTLKAGTTLYHGTDNPDFDEESANPNPYSWCSTSRTVAERFARRSGGWGGTQRVIEYCFIGEVQLPEITSARHMQQFAEEHGINLMGVDEMRDSAEAAGIPGWIIPSNYPDGDDILIADTSLMDYVGTTVVGLVVAQEPTSDNLERLADKLEASSTLLHGSAYAPVHEAEKLFRRLIRGDMAPVEVTGVERLIEELRRQANTVANPASSRMQEAAAMLEELGKAGLCL